MTTVAVCIPSIPTRQSQLHDALCTVVTQTRQPDEIHVAVDLDAQGEAATRNRALYAAATDWVAFLDDDDLLYPQHLDRLVQHAEDTGADLVYPWHDSDHEVEGVEGRPFDAEQLRAGNFIPVTFLVRRTLAVAVGGFPAPGWHEAAGVAMPDTGCPCVDWGFLLALVEAGANIVHLPERTWRWRRWDGQTAGLPWRDVA